ncbi:MAG: arginine-tRNA-protein transferase, partial [Phaeodactylibacter sp.]|nr:arginine-tRNA-protein transferase [Phaeodactylibacter sp.]
ASIMGIYDPDYNRHSLGFFTMLMEIDFCMQRGMEFFYPGYVVPGYSRFDYKLRIGRAEDIEYFDLRTQGWQPYSGLAPSDVPLKKMENRLDDMQQFLIRNNFWSQKLYYPLFEANLFGFWHAPYFDFPVFLLCSPRINANSFLMAVYDPRKEAFQLLRCSLFDDLQFYFNEAYTDSFDRRKNFLDLVVVEEVLASSPRPGEILQAF